MSPEPRGRWGSPLPPVQAPCSGPAPPSSWAWVCTERAEVGRTEAQGEVLAAGSSWPLVAGRLVAAGSRLVGRLVAAGSRPVGRLVAGSRLVGRLAAGSRLVASVCTETVLLVCRRIVEGLTVSCSTPGGSAFDSFELVFSENSTLN